LPEIVLEMLIMVVKPSVRTSRNGLLPMGIHLVSSFSIKTNSSFCAGIGT
jgi:hypothetical protein